MPRNLPVSRRSLLRAGLAVSAAGPLAPGQLTDRPASAAI
ncbi:MAG: class A beta-lactamase, partial [Pseudonocardiaceae bacterium]|nr:class A beta-lactamase [Pseudonocardiaceae bacterium]